MKLFNSIIINYFRMLYLVAIVGKIIYSESFLSSFINLFDQVNILDSMNKYLILGIIFFLLILVDLLLIYFTFKSRKMFLWGNLIFFIMTIIYSFTLINYKISGDCGCFGKILVFENSYDNLYFIMFNFILAITTIIVEATNHKNRVLISN